MLEHEITVYCGNIGNLASIFGLLVFKVLVNTLKPFWRYSAFFLLSLLLLLAVLSAYVYSQRDAVKAGIVQVLNNRLNSPVQVNGSIYLSLFENFPDVSLGFPNLQIQALEQGVVADYALLQAGRLSLSFSLWDLFKRNYRLKQLTISDAIIDLRFDEQGQPNYQIWKDDTSSVYSASFAINKLVLRRVQMRYVNASENQLLSASFTDADFKGDFSQRKFRLQARASLEGGSLQLDGKQFLRNQQLALNLSMEVDLDTETVFFPDSELRLNREKLQLTGYHRWGEPTETDLKFSAERFRAAQVLAFYSDASNFLSGLEVDGDLNLLGRWNYSPGEPELMLETHLSDARLSYLPYALSYRGSTSIKATYNRKEQLDLYFEQLNLKQDKYNLLGRMHYRQRDDMLEGKLKGMIDLNAYQKVFDQWEISDLKGQAGIDHTFRLYPNSDKPVVIAGALQLNNVSGRYPGYVFSELSAVLKSDAGAGLDLQLQNMQLDTVQLSGQLQIKNYQALYNESAGTLQVSGVLKADRWRWATDLSGESRGPSGLPPFRMDVRLQVARLYWYDYRFDGLDARLQGNSEYLMIGLDDWQLAGGRLTGLLHWESKASGYELRGALDGRKMAINKLFTVFDDFGQDFITHKHLSGQLDLRASLLMRFDKDFNLLPKHMEVFADLDLQKGELNGFEPMNSLSRFVDARELQNLRFQRLTNHIEIREGMINIGEMDINSNAARMHLSGKHSFENAYTYYIQLYLSDLWKKRQKQISFDPGLAEDQLAGGVKLSLVLEGQGADFKIRYNKLEVRDQLQQTAGAVRKDIGKLIKEELDGTARNKNYENSRLNEIMPVEEAADTLEKVPEKEFDPVYLRKPKSRRGGR